MSNEKLWSIIRNKETGARELVWDCRKNPADHSDFIEMSGLFVSATFRYGIEQGRAAYNRIVVFPMMRRHPNNTGGSYRLEFSNERIPNLLVNGEPFEEVPDSFTLRGRVESKGEYHRNGVARSDINSAETDAPVDLKYTHVFFPCTDKAAFCEILTLWNTGKNDVTFSFTGDAKQRYDTYLGPKAVVSSWIDAGFYNCHAKHPGTEFTVKPGNKVRFCLIFSARTGMSEDIAEGFNPANELKKRMKRVDELVEPLKMDSGDEMFDTMFEFAKIRAGENVFRTANGDIHCPGGKAYYAAVWANDQVEYAGPWQAYTGDKLQLTAGYNAYSWYYPYMDTYDIPFPSSIIAEGFDYWNGAGDRGDAAMYLYGASRYALTSGNLGPDNALWKAILWCAGFCLSRQDENGIIHSDSDELEGRLPHGDTNLSTNMLSLGGFKYAARIARALGDEAHAAQFESVAEKLESDCEKFFGAEIHGFKTYRYCEGNTTLRSWICLPLCVGVETRKDDTTAAIVSDYLMSDAGQLSEEGTKVAWDRSTLYGLRGMFRVGKCDESYDYLKYYCSQRLLGQHVPYAVEAYPEGSQRHLSAESALFCQIITEGMLAIEPLSFSSFSFVPQLPKALDHLSVRGIHAFGQTFDVEVRRTGWSVSTASSEVKTGKYGARALIEF